MTSTLTSNTTAYAGFDGHILLDVPAENPTLNFEQIASALATVVQTSQPRFAVGIFGGWGCGKSTLMDDIARRLRAGCRLP